MFESKQKKLCIFRGFISFPFHSFFSKECLSFTFHSTHVNLHMAKQYGKKLTYLGILGLSDCTLFLIEAACYKMTTWNCMHWQIYSVTCQLLVMFPAVFDHFSGQFSKEDNSLGFKIFLNSDFWVLVL